MSVRPLSALVVAAALALCVVACERNALEPPKADVQISGAGATFPAPLYQKWLEEYNKTHTDKAVFYDPVGSGDGVRKFVKQQVDFGASDAAMTDEEITKVERGVKLIPATAGIIVLAYNLKGLNAPLKLPRDVYLDMFAGKITAWNDPRIKEANPNLNLPATNIVLVSRLDSSGTTFAFTNHLSAVNKAWRDRGPGVGKLVKWPANTMTARGNEGVAGRVKISDGSIGYVEYGYAQRAGLSLAWLENKAGRFIEPSPANGQAALANSEADMPANLRLFLPDPPGEASYPLVTYTWMLLYGQYPEALKGALVKDFVKWGLLDGQQYSKDLGFCNLPSRIASLATKAVDEIR